MSNYIYTLQEPYRFYFDNYYYYDGQFFRADWLLIDDLTINIPAGYSWNGCSPKFKIAGKVFSLPNFGQKTYHASLVHDALYQYSAGHGLPRETCDRIFLALMQDQGFKYAKFYYRMVRLFGGLFWKEIHV